MQSLGLHPYPDVSMEMVNTILAEIHKDDATEWWVPKASQHDIFERAYMKFVNGNLNYFDFNNMIHLAENNPRNPAFTNTYTVCEQLRGVLEAGGYKYGPFGRMNIWKVPPGAYIKPHKDNFQYHWCITRFVVNLNLNEDETDIVIEGQTVKAHPTTMFQFLPDRQLHAFKNNSDEYWYFLAFDLWDLAKFSQLTLIKGEAGSRKFLGQDS